MGAGDACARALRVGRRVGRRVEAREASRRARLEVEVRASGASASLIWRCLSVQARVGWCFMASLRLTSVVRACVRSA